ncbi:MAG: hypothetical protein KG012_09355 [Deltaproteobacteria bacterium]|nr:hypothetical protein [Deltaproteobacteria bacterium]
MEKTGWLENFLEPLERRANEILKTQSNIKEDSNFKKLNKGKGVSRWQANPKYQSAKDLLKQIQSFKELILKNGTPRDVIYKLTWILGIAYDMGWPVPSQYVIGRSKGGKAPKKKKGILLAIKWAREKSKQKSARGLWNYFKNKNFEKDEYEVYFYQDPTGAGEDLLCQKIDSIEKGSIKFEAFKKYVYNKNNG